MNIYQLLERIEKITDELNSVEGEFEALKTRYHQIDARRRDLYCERKKACRRVGKSL